jgi:glycosyltransferase involved in cell wall biosynthesis
MEEQEKDPLVSVVIPCYKQAHFLPESLESALGQTWPSIEAIVVDDGSPDDSAQVAARYPGVRCVRQKNRGISEARNAGFSASRGDYVIFLDADDRLSPRAVETHLRCFSEHSDAAFVVGDIDHITVEGAYRSSPRWPVLKAEQYQELLRVNHVANTVAVMFRRSVIETVGAFEGFFEPAEDYELLLRVSRSFPSAHHSNVVAQYRRHCTNVSRKGVVMLRAMSRVMRAQRPFVKGNLALETALRRGERYWREHYGAVTMKEVWALLACGRVWPAVQTSAVLLWHVRWRVVILPWKYRRQLITALKQPFRTFESRRTV